MLTSGSLRRAASLFLAVAVGVVGTQAFAAQDESTHLPADKTAVAGAALDDMGPNEEHVVLSERMRVSSPEDLILGVTLECSIITRLVTTNSGETDRQQGGVDVRITIDDRPVAVQTAGEGSGDNGRVTFCNRVYSRTVSDQDGDGTIDEEDDFLRTKAANAFNWIAFNVGQGGYDAGGDNIIDVKVYARYRDSGGPCSATNPADSGCSRAWIGKRTLVIEPVKAANTEVSEPTDPAPAEEEPSLLPL